MLLTANVGPVGPPAHSLAPSRKGISLRPSVLFTMLEHHHADQRMLGCRIGLSQFAGTRGVDQPVDGLPGLGQFRVARQKR